MYNYLTYISIFEVYLFSIQYKKIQCPKGVSIYCIILLFSDTHATLKIFYVFVFLVMYFATYSEKSIGLQAFLFSDTTDCFSIGQLWVSKCLSMNICSQANIVKGNYKTLLYGNL